MGMMQKEMTLMKSAVPPPGCLPMPYYPAGYSMYGPAPPPPKQSGNQQAARHQDNSEKERQAYGKDREPRKITETDWTAEGRPPCNEAGHLKRNCPKQAPRQSAGQKKTDIKKLSSLHITKGLF